MRRLVTLLVVSAVAVAPLASSALAKDKSKKGSFQAQALPYPGPDNGCNDPTAPSGFGPVVEMFKAPANGQITVTMTEFDGDWDLFLNDADGGMLVSSTQSQLQASAAEEEVSIIVGKGMEVQMVPCNWVGGPSATVNWVFTAGK